jgi:hypothetical protein
MSNSDELYRLVKSDAQFKKYNITPTPYRPIISESNLNDGFIQRYFCKYVPASNVDIQEVDEFVFKSLKKNPFYQTIKVKWKIVGRLNDYIINPDCCNNRKILIIEQTGTRLNLSPDEFNKRKQKIGDKIEADGYIIGFGVETENRKNIEHADLTMTGLIRYIRNYTEYWQGE